MRHLYGVALYKVEKVEILSHTVLSTCQSAEQVSDGSVVFVVL